MQQASLPVDTIVTLDDTGCPVTTSKAIADGVGNPHKTVIQLVRQNVSDLEDFGGVAFEMRPFETRGGTQHREVAILNEPQSTLLMTYMRNNAVVREFKKRLVRAFFEMARERQQAPEPAARAFGSTGDADLDRRLDVEQGILERAGIPKGEHMARLLRAAVAPSEPQAPAEPMVDGPPAHRMAALIGRHFDFTHPPVVRMTATEVLQACGIAEPTRAQATAAGVAIARLSGREPMRGGHGNLHAMPRPLAKH